MNEYITVENGVATAWRDGVAVGQWEAGTLDYAAAGLEWPGCSCGDAECHHGTAHYWGEGWSVAHIESLISADTQEGDMS